MIKRLARSIREYKKATILSPIFVALEVVLEVVIPLLMAELIDRGIAGGDMSAVLRTGIVLLLSALVALVFGLLSGKYAASASAGFAKNLRGDMYRNIQEFSFSNIDKYETSGLVTRLTTDVTNVQNAFQMLVRIAVRAPIMIVLSLISAFSISANLSLIFLCALPVLGGGIYLIMRNAHPIITKAIRLYDRLNTVVQENLRGIRVVKSFTRENHETEKFEGVSGEIHDSYVKAERLIAFNSPLMQFCMYGATLLISWLGAQLIVGGSLTTGQLTSLISYMSQILGSLMMFSMVLLMMVISMPSARRIVEVLDEQSDIRNGEKPITAVKDGSIAFENVSFRYGGDADCLSGVSFQVESGQVLGILGGTGSGKSTLAQLIPRLYDPTEGVVKVGGNDVRGYDLDALRAQVAMVLQKNELFSGTVKENLRWGNPDATDAGLVHACEIAQADAFIMQFPDGYDTKIEQGGANLSGGQKQRLCIARALLKNPVILILDDSTSAVDTKTDAHIRRALQEEVPQMTQVIIAQRVSSIRHADKILVLDEGRVESIGTHDELIKTSPIYREVYQSQTKGEEENAA